MTYYQNMMTKAGWIPKGIDPRHVEAYIRLEYPTLNSLPDSTFRREIKIALGCIREAGIDAAERCAKSFGL